MHAADSPEPTPPPPPGAKPSATPLGASLQADYEAIRNDLEQAHDLAADFQRQLAGKSNEVAHFKNLLERTQTDFNRLEAHVQELRKERHRLANEVMRSTALELEVKRSREEIQRLREQMETLRDAGGSRVHELLIVNEEQQREIGRLRAAMEVLKAAGASATPGSEAKLQQQISELTGMVKQLQGALDGKCRSDRRPVGHSAIDPDVINISFNS